MCRLCRENIISNKKINDKIKSVIHKIKKTINPDKIILYGSYSRGDYHECSDVDLVVIADFKENFFDRIGKILDLNDTDLDFEPLGYTKEEFNKMIKNENRFALHLLDEGIEL